MPRILLTDEEKKERIRQNNIKNEVIRYNYNNKQFFCEGCQRSYGYTHKKDHFTGSKHKCLMNILKEKNHNHIEQHEHNILQTAVEYCDKNNNNKSSKIIIV